MNVYGDEKNTIEIANVVYVNNFIQQYFAVS